MNEYKYTNINRYRQKSVIPSQYLSGIGQRNFFSSCSSTALCFCWMKSYSYSYSGLKAVIRAPSRPPCTGTLEWFESGPDIPEVLAAQTPSSSQSATNSRIAVLPLKIVIWTGEGWRAVWREPAEWRMNDRGVEAEQERRVVYSIPYPVTMLSQRHRGKGVLQRCELGTCVSALQDSDKE